MFRFKKNLGLEFGEFEIGVTGICKREEEEKEEKTCCELSTRMGIAYCDRTLRMD